MAKLTQGTTLYFLDDEGAVQAVAATSINGISAQRESIETTDLGCNAKTFMPGLMAAGKAQFAVHFDPSNPVHTKLHDLYVNGATLHWALGWSDGTAAPTVTAGALQLPLGRTFLTFDGFLTDVTFDFAINNVVNSQVSIQISGLPAVVAKSV